MKRTVKVPCSPSPSSSRKRVREGDQQVICCMQDQSSVVNAIRHIHELRTKKFSIGAPEPNPLTQDLHHAVTSLSHELYTKDVHFLMELIQNAEDNEYGEGVEPTLEFVFTETDISGSGAPATLLVFNNEVGFSRPNMESICSVGRSTKRGKRQTEGFIGEKGIGFKSVFLVSKEPHIVSNGYKVKFNEEPDSCCGIGYIVPKWIEDRSFISKLHSVYGSAMPLPTTTIVLPLKPEKIKPVMQQLLQIHPELLLFLSKIKRLNVRVIDSRFKNGNGDCSVFVSHGTDHVVRSEKADSRVMHLAVEAKPGASEEKCCYYIWREALPVKPNCKVAGREGVEKWIISLAFPFEKRLTRGRSCVGVFAYLPTTLVTNFPFIIQADFKLSSSRESILFDSKWNSGILDCVAAVFVNAFTSLVKDCTPSIEFAKAFQFLPTEESPVAELNEVTKGIRIMLNDAEIIPYETFNNANSFCRPSSAVRVLGNFRELLIKMAEEGASLDGLASLSKHPIDASLDIGELKETLDFLNVPSLSNSWDWYRECIMSCNLISQASEQDYADLLWIFADNADIFKQDFLMTTPLFKYVDQCGNVELCNASQAKTGGFKIQFALDTQLHAWLNSCNLELSCVNDVYFLPNSSQASIVRHEHSSIIANWLMSEANIGQCSAYDYGNLILRLSRKGKHLLKFTQFLYHSYSKGFISEADLSSLVTRTPIVDGSGTIKKGYRKGTLVCGTGSNWAKLFGDSNPLSVANYFDLGKHYLRSGSFAGEHTPKGALLEFLTKHTEALDLPQLSPPHIKLPVSSSELTSEQAFLLLDWIRLHRTLDNYLPDVFVNSIRHGKWMKTYRGFQPPCKSILPNEMGKIIFEMTSSVLADFSILDEAFYENRINLYVDELKYLGVTSGSDDIQKVVMNRFKSLASSEMDKSSALSLLALISLLKERNVLDEEWLSIIKNGRWLKTSQGNCAPIESVFLRSELESESVSRITSLPVIDVSSYGDKLDLFSAELAVLGAKTDLDVYELVPLRIEFPENLSTMTSACGLFLLECMRRLHPDATRLITQATNQPWLRTTCGFQCPSAAILPCVDVVCLLNIVDVPLVDEAFYGSSMRSYLVELRLLGAGVDFNSSLRIISAKIHESLSSSNFSAANVMSLLQGVRNMCTTTPNKLQEICEALEQESLFKTRHGYKIPRQSILSSPSWASISLFVDLPLIDDSYYGFDIYSYQDELEVLGVIIGLQDGFQFVVEGLKSPIKKGLMTLEGTFFLLTIIGTLTLIPYEQPSVDRFLNHIKKSEFLRTSRGDKSPSECILFLPEWKDIVDCADLPFLDEGYYGKRILEHKQELEHIGVRTHVVEVCPIIYACLYSLVKTSSIRRIYKFLRVFGLHSGAVNKDDLRVWVPMQKNSEEGQWVDSKVCVLHDRDSLFSSLYYCLDNYYEEELLPLFLQAFDVVEVPILGHYIQLWSSWLKRDNFVITTAECQSFWGYILENWNTETKELVGQNVTELPALCHGGLQLRSKEKLFIPDLVLMEIFMTCDKYPLFVWFPRRDTFCSVSSSKLHEVYAFLGVKKLSESVQCCVKNLHAIDLAPHGYIKRLISRGIIKLILGYLAGPKVDMAARSRHQTAKSLLDISVCLSTELCQVIYCLNPPGCDPLEVETHKVVHWDKKMQLLVIDKDSYENQKKSLKFGSYFAQEVADNLLAEQRPDAVVHLRNLIQLGLAYEFEEDSVDFLLLRENLQFFPEDEEFLDAVYPSKGIEVSDSGALSTSHLEELGPQ